MKHTNSARGTGGQFARSDGPKAKRIEVWLQPQALDLLDTLCKQWNVGRGKAISHLICNGPVAPAAWLEVDSKRPPTPSAPPAGLKRVADLEDDPLEPPPPPPPAPTTSDRPEPRFAIGDVVAFTVGPRQGQTFTIAEKMWVTAPEPHWRYGAGGGTGVAESALELAPPPEPTPEPELQPEPTPSAREEMQQLFDQIAAQGRERWEKITAEAKRIGITAKQLERILPLLKLSAANLPLSPEAVQAVHQELERGQRQAGAHERDRRRRIQAIRKVLADDPELLMELAHRCHSVEMTDWLEAKPYLLQMLPAVGIKPYKVLSPGLWKALRDLFPDAGAWQRLNEQSTSALALFWGAVLRLDSLDGRPPDDDAAFLEWSQFTVYRDHANRRKDHQDEDLNPFDLFSGRLTTDRAREILGLPEAGTDLTRKAINDAYRDLARQHHPDAGGDPARFQRITEARDRLLLAVGG